MSTVAAPTRQERGNGWQSFAAQVELRGKRYVRLFVAGGAHWSKSARFPACDSVRVFRSIEDYQSHRSRGSGPVGSEPTEVVGVTIGNFDGFHLGHQQLVRELFTRLIPLASKQGAQAKTALLTFWPHPRKVLSGASNEDFAKLPYGELLTIRAKMELARDIGFDYFFAIRFTKHLSEISPEQFVERFLVRGMAARLVVVGDDWRFGKDRLGDTNRLQVLGEAGDFLTHVVPQVTIEGARVSSSAVRLAIQRTDLDLASSLLGRRVSLSGRVVEGDQRGRTIGFPTANLHLRNQVIPPDGVYAAFVEFEGQTLDAVVNIGVRPTFGGTHRVVEVHLIDRKDCQLYRRRLRVNFVAKLRGEQTFAGAKELKAQIKLDIDAANTILHRSNSNF